MTVCIAAICGHASQPMIIGASDRMITAGDIEFDRPVPKLWRFPNSTVVAMVAGDAGAQDEICSMTAARIGSGRLKIHEIVDAYCAELGAFHARSTERQVLYPLGLTMESFLARQQELGSNFCDQMRYEMKGVKQHLGIETILTGVDPDGPHIFTVRDDGSVVCSDSIGFAAIGFGARHAESQFMFQRYSFNRDFASAFLLTYSATRRAEIAPGVGQGTDMFVIMGEWLYSPIGPGPMADAKRIYETMDEAQQTAIAQANADVRATVQSVLEQSLPVMRPGRPRREPTPSRDTHAEQQANDGVSVAPPLDGQPSADAPEPIPTDPAPTN